MTIFRFVTSVCPKILTLPRPKAVFWYLLTLYAKPRFRKSEAPKHICLYCMFLGPWVLGPWGRVWPLSRFLTMRNHVGCYGIWVWIADRNHRGLMKRIENKQREAKTWNKMEISTLNGITATTGRITGTRYPSLRSSSISPNKQGLVSGNWSHVKRALANDEV